MSNEEKEEWIRFPAKVEKKFRIWIPRYVREILQLYEGDYVEISIRKLKKRGLLRV
jgi:AbrB family looped-hinge helix DNA binding protein